MSKDRYALLGLGRSRSPWFGQVSQWATSGALPADFAKCVSVADVRQRLGALQPFSALLVDAGIPGVDRDLFNAASSAGVVTIVVEATSDDTQYWQELGAATTLLPSFSPSDLLLALAAHANVITATRDHVVQAIVEEATTWSGDLIAVCGPGGTGTSSVAIALAQGLGSDGLDGDLVVLADLSRNGEQAMLHDASDIAPGIEELVDAHRTRRPSTAEVRSLTFGVPARNYRVLLGQRRPTAWSAMSVASADATLSSLRRSFRTVIADITADFEGEADGGSTDVEERNALARTAALKAGIVIAVGSPGMKGVYSLAATVRALVALGVEPERIITVVNRSPKSPLAKSETVRALRSLTTSGESALPLNGPLFLPERAIDAALRDGAPLPKQVVRPITDGVNAVLAATVPTEPAVAGASKVTPGSFGLFDSAVGE